MRPCANGFLGSPSHRGTGGGAEVVVGSYGELS